MKRWRPDGNGIPGSLFEHVPHWEVPHTAGEPPSPLFPRVDYDPAEERCRQEERDREEDYLEERWR